MDIQANNQTENIQPSETPKSVGGRTVFNRNKANILLWAVLILALILCVTVIGQVLGKGYISIGGFSMFRVATGSMEPELPVGTLLVTRQTHIGNIQTGDIVTFRSKQTGMLGVIITHRVVAIHEDKNGNLFLETKGDANQYADGYFVDECNLIGRVVYATGEGNMFAVVVQFLSSPAGFLACIVLPCLLGGIFLIRDTVRNIKKEIDAMNEVLQEPEEPSKNALEEQMGKEAYLEYCDQIRNELLEELKQSAAQVHTQTQPDDRQE